MLRLCFLTALLLRRDACWKNTYNQYLSPSPLLLLFFASILLLLLLRRDLHFCFLVEVLLLLIIFLVGCAAAAAGACAAYNISTEERYRLLFLPSTFLSFTLRCFGRLLLLLFLAASISVL